jgi:malonyl-CoA/methylmalonyl-CoA synthetase
MRNLLFDTLFDQKPGEAIFVELADGLRWSYSDILNETARVANALVSLGVQPGDRVAAQVDKSVSAIALYLGTIRAGAIFLPLNTAYTATEIEYFISDAEPALLVCRPVAEAALRPIAASTATRLETLDATGNAGSWSELVNAAESEFDNVARDQQDLAAILYTSGTTGRAKGAMISHLNLASNARTLVELWHFTSDDVLLHALPIFHTHGLFVAVNTTLVAGGSLLFLPRFDADEVVSLMPRASVLMGVPTFYTRLLDNNRFTAEQTQGMRLFVSGSAPLLEETHKAFHQRTDQAILERYGMTETNMNTSNPYEGNRRAGTVGFPLPGVDIRITHSDSGVELPDGEIGMLEVRGPNVFKGYWRMEQKTAEEFREDGFFITGDLARIDEQGYVVIVGRDKDLIISGGYNVYPKEIELEIDALPGIVESAVIGLPHSDFGESVAAVVVAERGSSIDEQSIVTEISNRLAAYKRPRRIFFVEQLPRNSMGKVQKNLLRVEYKDTYTAASSIA